MASSGSRTIFTAHSTTSPRALDFDTPAAACHWDHAQVNARSETVVQANFFLAEMASLVQRREIEKAEIDGFLDFVDQRAGQEDHGNMRLPHFDALDRERICIRVRHCGNQTCEFHETISFVRHWQYGVPRSE